MVIGKNKNATSCWPILAAFIAGGILAAEGILIIAIAADIAQTSETEKNRLALNNIGQRTVARRF
jgi:hypothetical protein